MNSNNTFVAPPHTLTSLDIPYAFTLKHCNMRKKSTPYQNTIYALTPTFFLLILSFHNPIPQLFFPLTFLFKSHNNQLFPPTFLLGTFSSFPLSIPPFIFTKPNTHFSTTTTTTTTTNHPSPPLQPPITTTFMETLSFTSNPLFSSIVTLYILIILYFPPFLLTTIISFSPLLISTLILLLFLLRLGASQQLKSYDDLNWAETPTSPEPEPEPEPKPEAVVEDGAEDGAKAEPLCDRVKTRLLSEFRPGPEPEPEPVILDHGMGKQSAKTEPHCSWVKTRPSAETGPGPGPDPDCCDEGWADFDCSKLGEEEEEEEEEERHCNWVETRPTTDSGPGPEYELEVESKPEAEEGPSGRSRAQDWQWLARPESGTSNMFCREWEVGAPLEVIYEAYEGEEDEEEGQNDAFGQNNQTSSKIERYPSLSRYYPESGSDSNSDSGSDSSGSSWDGEFPRVERWHEEERNELIEIALDNNDSNCHGNNNKGIKTLVEEANVDDDEDNLIEIDISPTRTSCEFSW